MATGHLCEVDPRAEVERIRFSGDFESIIGENAEQFLQELSGQGAIGGHGRNASCGKSYEQNCNFTENRCEKMSNTEMLNGIPW